MHLDHPCEDPEVGLHIRGIHEHVIAGVGPADEGQPRRIGRIVAAHLYAGSADPLVDQGPDLLVRQHAMGPGRHQEGDRPGREAGPKERFHQRPQDPALALIGDRSGIVGDDHRRREAATPPGRRPRRGRARRLGRRSRL